MIDTRPRHVPRLWSRPPRVTDVAECMLLLPGHMGLSPAQRAALPELWVRLLQEPSIISGVMEDRALPAGERLQGWGVSIMLPQAMVRELELETAPKPYITRRIYEGLLARTFAPMTDREIGVDNSRGELVNFVMHFGMRPTQSEAYFHSVLTMANDSFRAFTAGYQMRTIFYENSAAALPIAMSSGFEPRRLFDAEMLERLDPADRPALYGLTRDEAQRRLPGTPVRNSFEFQPPRFRFNATQRRLLWEALFDENDDWLQSLLGVSTHGLKKLWRGIYERIDDVAPDFFGDAGDDDGKRGPEKRRQVLAYVRQRAEELRPWVATRGD